MNKERTIINSNEIIIEKDISIIELLNEVPLDFKGKVIVKGNIYGCAMKILEIPFSLSVLSLDLNFENRVKSLIFIKGSLHCDELKTIGNIKISEDFYCRSDDLLTQDIEVGRNFDFKGDIHGGHIKVGNDFILDGNINVADINIGNDFLNEGNIHACDIEIGNSLVLDGDVACENLEVKSKITGTGNISVENKICVSSIEMENGALTFQSMNINCES